MSASPMNFFDITGAGNQYFQTGAQIGAMNSPAASPAIAIRGILDRANKLRDQQNEYALKSQLMQHSMNKALEAEQWKFNQGTPQADALKGWNMDPSLPANQPKVGDVTMVYQPVYDKYGRIVGKKLMNPRSPGVWDIGQGGTGPGAAPDAEAAAVQAQFQQLMGELNG